MCVSRFWRTEKRQQLKENAKYSGKYSCRTDTFFLSANTQRPPSADETHFPQTFGLEEEAAKSRKFTCS